MNKKENLHLGFWVILIVAVLISFATGMSLGLTSAEIQASSSTSSSIFSQLPTVYVQENDTTFHTHSDCLALLSDIPATFCSESEARASGHPYLCTECATRDQTEAEANSYYQQGYSDGLSEGLQQSRIEAYNEGYSKGYERGKITSSVEVEQYAYSYDEPEQNEEMVWVPVHGGTKYHSYSSCSNMKDPVYITLSEAVAYGYTPCSKCW